ncbi:MAG: hypothetical protein ACI311_05325 [Bacilli bacterium]
MINNLIKASKHILVFILFSFIGWFWETILVLILYNSISNIGFLHLPICPIYGTTILLCYLLLGTPNNFKLPLKRLSNKKLKTILYLLILFIVPTIIEVIVGNYFYNKYGIVLWSYEGLPLTIGKYINLFVSLFWAVCIFLIMRYLIEPIYRFLNNVSTFNILGLSLTFILLTAIDFIICIKK